MCGGWLKQDNFLNVVTAGYTQIRKLPSEYMLLRHQALKSTRPKIQVTVKEDLHLYKSVIILSYYPSMLTRYSDTCLVLKDENKIAWTA